MCIYFCFGFLKNKFALIYDVQIENHSLYFRDHAQSKCGSLDFIDHIPGGGDKKVLCRLSCTC